MAVKLIISLTALLLSLNLEARDLYVLVVGQSISANCNEHVFEESTGVYQVDLNGDLKPAKDPFEWADCDKGAMWLPLGTKIVTSGFANRVIFMPIGVGGTSVSDWQPGGRAFGKLKSALSLANQKSIKFDYAFWHQGSSDYGQDPIIYGKALSQVLTFISLNTKVDKWIVAQHSKCGSQYDHRIAKEQKNISLNPQFRRFPGPNTNEFGMEYRYDGCHLNRSGQEKMAELWFNSIMAAEKIDYNFQRESLLFYFRQIFD